MSSKDEAKARLVVDFVADYRYGQPFFEGRVEERGEYSWRVRIVIHSPTTEHVAMTLSAFVVCLSRLYDLDYDGWGCVIQK